MSYVLYLYHFLKRVNLHTVDSFFYIGPYTVESFSNVLKVLNPLKIHIIFSRTNFLFFCFMQPDFIYTMWTK